MNIKAEVVDKGFQLIFLGSPLEDPAPILVLLANASLVRRVLIVASSRRNLSMTLQSVALEGTDTPKAC
jgi:hypothetical protein